MCYVVSTSIVETLQLSKLFQVDYETFASDGW